jgi:hypothetical protein
LIRIAKDEERKRQVEDRGGELSIHRLRIGVGLIPQGVGECCDLLDV